jgi:hypothetical protein
LLRQSFGKIITLVIAISLLTAGIAPANPSCNAECCVKPKSNGLHSKVHTPAADLLSDCCSGLETAPCPHMLESEVNPARVNLAASVNSALFSPQPHFHLTYSMSSNIRGPSVPLYLQTLTLLI